LYGQGAWDAWLSFKNLGRLLQETHIPFEVVYSAPGEPMHRDIKPGDLKGYSVLVVPKGHHFENSTETVLKQYAATGGHLIRMDDHTNALTAVSLIRQTPNCMAFITTANRDTSLILFVKERKVMLHLVNYSYDYKTHSFTPQTAIKVRMELPPADKNKSWQAVYLSPDFAGEQVLTTATNGRYIDITVPKLEAYGVVVLRQNDLAAAMANGPVIRADAGNAPPAARRPFARRG
jgi:hypothetical protein